MAQREELGHLDYFLERLAELRNRGLIAPDAYATASSEGQSRRAAINASRRICSLHGQGSRCR